MGFREWLCQIFRCKREESQDLAKFYENDNQNRIVSAAINGFRGKNWQIRYFYTPLLTSADMTHENGHTWRIQYIRDNNNRLMVKSILESNIEIGRVELTYESNSNKIVRIHMKSSATIPLWDALVDQ